VNVSPPSACFIVVAMPLRTPIMRNHLVCRL
jgi:hypothetical protein